MSRFREAGLACALLLCSCTQYPSGGDLRLHNDMIEQPSFRPQEDPLPLAKGSIPLGGREAPMTVEEAEARLRNPVPATADSLAKGEKLFGVYCFPCHGRSGQGDGPVASKMTKPANLTDSKYIKRKDGFFYEVIRSGSGLMPPYYEDVSPKERWCVVNYIRKLQKP
jgi:mono/diheme cytochrome c family protein